MNRATTILLYGRTGSGKTTQIGKLAEDVKARTGKITRLYTADAGGLDTLAPYIDLGIIETVEIGGSNPWIWLNKVIRGNIKNSAGAWVLDPKANEKIGFYAFESTHAIAKLLQADMENQAASGVNVGGDTNTSFTITDGTTNIKIGTTKGFQKFAIPQSQVMDAIRVSQRLDSEYVLWTAGISKDDDEINTTKVIGPDVLGKALTHVLPMEFNYTFRQDVVPTKDPKVAPRHILFLGTHQDMATGNATALGNMRRPLDAPKLESYAIEPADLVYALKIVRSDAKEAAKEAIKKRLGAKLG